MINNLPDRIYLCGFMGAGKSTIGKLLAEKLSMPFIDLDTRIEENREKSIPVIFEEEGEEAFRQAERSALLEVIREEQGVIALGGGALHNQHLLDHVKVNGLLIFIETPFSVIFDRIAGKTDRPLLLDEDGNMKEEESLREELRSLYHKRLPLYEQAELQINSRNYESREELVRSLIKKIRNHVSFH